MDDPVTITATIDRHAWGLLLEGWGDGSTSWDLEYCEQVNDGVIDPIHKALDRGNTSS